MKIIIHIGMPKTGSTAIQKTLARNRDLLRENGILYPANPTPFTNQAKHLIFLPLLCRGDVDQWKNFPGGAQKIRETYGHEFDFYDYWINDLIKQIVIAQPHTLVLSEEGLFAAFGRINSKIHNNLEKFLSDIGSSLSEVEIVGYIRSPADYYLSMCQERIKRYASIKGFSFANYIEKLKTINKIYNSQHQIFAFDKKFFPLGDVVRHFTKTILRYELASNEMPNETISAAAMFILEDYWTLTLSKDSVKASHQEMKSLLTVIRLAEERIKLPKPTLKSSVRAMLMHSMVDDMEWLKDFYEIDFTGSVANTKVNAIESKANFKPKSVADIIEYEESNSYTLLLEILRQKNSLPVKRKGARSIDDKAKYKEIV